MDLPVRMRVKTMKELEKMKTTQNSNPIIAKTGKARLPMLRPSKLRDLIVKY